MKVLKNMKIFQGILLLLILGMISCGTQDGLEIDDGFGSENQGGIQSSGPLPSGNYWKSFCKLWSSRAAHGSVVFQEKLWVVGGAPTNGPSNADVWSTETGANWTRATGCANWARDDHDPPTQCGRYNGRVSMGLVSFDDKMWLLGGLQDSTTTFNDVWSTSDGKTWTQTTAYDASPSPGTLWTPRFRHQALAFGGKMWVLGGGQRSNGDGTNDIWSSVDGAAWVEKLADTDSPPPTQWGRRNGHRAVVFDGKMWVMGGSSLSPNRIYSDIWSSPDGVTWTRVRNSFSWGGGTPRHLVVLGDKMFALGMGSNSGVWSSSDGVTWEEKTDNARWKVDSGYSATVFQNHIWIMGGSDPSTRRFTNAGFSNYIFKTILP